MPESSQAGSPKAPQLIVSTIHLLSNPLQCSQFSFVKGKVHPIPWHEGPEGSRGISLLSFEPRR